MYPGLSHDEIIEECIKELNHYFEVGPEVVLISAEKGVQCVPFDESPQKKFPYFEGTYEVFDVPHTDFQIRYQPEQILAANGRKILTGTAFLCRKENERCLMLPSRYEKVDVEDFIREHLFSTMMLRRAMLVLSFRRLRNGVRERLLIYEAGALCGFFIAALMNAARAGQEIAIKFEEDKHGAGEEHPDGAGNRTGALPEAGRDRP